MAEICRELLMNMPRILKCLHETQVTHVLKELSQNEPVDWDKKGIHHNNLSSCYLETLLLQERIGVVGAF